MNVSYAIREATPHDIPLLVEFTLREAAEAEQRHLNRESAARGVAAAFGTPPVARYWIAVDEQGTPVASTSVITEWSNFHGGSYWWIQSLYIVPEHRGSGLVENLLRHLAAASREASALELRLYAHRDNERAFRAYRKSGFTESPYVILTLKAPGQDGVPSTRPNRTGGLARPAHVRRSAIPRAGR